MLPIHTVLHPTDFSDTSEVAFRLACAIAREYAARLIVLHVGEVPFTGSEVENLIYSPARNPKLYEKLQQLKPRDPEVQVEYRVVEGDPTTEILRAARESLCEVIILGTGGRPGLGRLLRRSVAEKVVRKASCPVVMVRSPDRPAKPQ